MDYKIGIFIINYPFPIGLMVVGLLGHILAITVLFKNKKLGNIGPRHIYCHLFLMDTINLLQTIFLILSIDDDYDIKSVDLL